jgi:hypothetical protein
MRQDLDTLCEEIERALEEARITVFRGTPRRTESRPQMDWDVAQFPDFRQFLSVAEAVGVRLMVFHQEKLTEDILDSAAERLQEADLPREEERDYERNLATARGYAGFVGAIDLSFEFDGTSYGFRVATPWFMDFLELVEVIEEAIEQTEPEDDSLGGSYFSQN